MLFGRDGTLLAQPFDANKLSIAGEALPVAGGVQHTTASAFMNFAISRDGSVLTYRPYEQQGIAQLTWFDRAGRNVGSLGPPGDYTHPRLSHDGKRVALVVPDTESGNRDIWLMDISSGRSTRLTFDSANDWNPAWSTDDSFIAFASDRRAPSIVYRKNVNGTGDEELLLSRSEAGLFPEDWSPDGRYLLINFNVGASNSLWSLPLASERIPHPLAVVSTGGGTARYSPDGKWVAYASQEGGTTEVYVSPANGGGKVRVSTAGGNYATWGKAGRELYYVAPGDVLMRADIRHGAAFEASIPEPLFRMCNIARGTPVAGSFYDASQDGNKFLVACIPDSPKPSAITVLLAWLGIVKGAGNP